MRHREKERTQQVLTKDQDVDTEEYQQKRKASTMQSSAHSVEATTILHKMLGSDEQMREFLLHEQQCGQQRLKKEWFDEYLQGI